MYNYPLLKSICMIVYAWIDIRKNRFNSLIVFEFIYFGQKNKYPLLNIHSFIQVQPILKKGNFIYIYIFFEKKKKNHSTLAGNRMFSRTLLRYSLFKKTDFILLSHTQHSSLQCQHSSVLFLGT